MPLVTILASGTHSGSAQSDPVSVPAGMTSIKVSLDATLFLNPAIETEMVAQYSVDGGANYYEYARCKRPGGAFLDGEGNPVTEQCLHTAKLTPLPAFLVRILLNITGGPVVTSATLEYS